MAARVERGDGARRRRAAGRRRAETSPRPGAGPEPRRARVGRQHESRPPRTTGWAGSTPPLAESTTTSGPAGLPEPLAAAPRSPPPPPGNACSAVHSERGEAAIVPAPITTASAQARSSPITNRSAALPAAISLFDPAPTGSRRRRRPSRRSSRTARLLEPERPPVRRRELRGQVERRQPAASNSTSSAGRLTMCQRPCPTGQAETARSGARHSVTEVGRKWARVSKPLQSRARSQALSSHASATSARPCPSGHVRCQARYVERK